MIRLFVIEDHLAIIVAGLKFHFRPGRDGIEITGTAENVDNAILSANPDEFDLFLLDLWIPGTMPLQNVRKLKDKFPGKPVVIYTSELSSSWKRRMMEEGVLAYITKNAGRHDIKNAIEKAARGETMFIGISDREDSNLTGNLSGDNDKRLSPIHKEILVLLMDGLTHKDIAGRLKTSPSNIEKTLQKLRLRFNSKNNLELINILKELGEI
jgi:two-component system, NarL family, invasion response regulator UvrY